MFCRNKCDYKDGTAMGNCSISLPVKEVVCQSHWTATTIDAN